jgi:hypothetical protein
VGAPTPSRTCFTYTYKYLRFFLFMYDTEHFCICHPSKEDAGIGPRTVATTALAVRRSNHSARSHPSYPVDEISKQSTISWGRACCSAMRPPRGTDRYATKGHTSLQAGALTTSLQAGALTTSLQAEALTTSLPLHFI